MTACIPGTTSHWTKPDRVAVPVVVEVPRGSGNKYELDEATGVFRMRDDAGEDGKVVAVNVNGPEGVEQALAVLRDAITACRAEFGA